uniref:Uncharacterized protein n=1 Tax=Romanomermis culicivorax TaxID=13658 RepID=A0A915JAF9_ROMCU
MLIFYMKNDSETTSNSNNMLQSNFNWIFFDEFLDNFKSGSILEKFLVVEINIKAICFTFIDTRVVPL